MKESARKPGDSTEQRKLGEEAIRKALERVVGQSLPPKVLPGGPELDGFADGPVPVCVEIWAHQGKAKGAQKMKVMRDMCKLLLCERLLGRRCRRIVAVADEEAVAFLNNSWEGEFARRFGIEMRVVSIPNAVRERIRQAQRRQYR